MVNRFFNQWPYRLDVEVYGTTDYWADPVEFMKLSGDCEDYSIVKFYALKELGFDARSLRIVVIKDEIRNIGHAVVAVYMDKTAYILDNLSDLVMDHDKYTHYTPQYSVNETYRWAHVMPTGDF
jgi:predicted transglutaminase-like cysteine proteinase